MSLSVNGRCAEAAFAGDLVKEHIVANFAPEPTALMRILAPQLASQAATTGALMAQFSLSRWNRGLAPIVIEAALCLTAQPTGFDILGQQRARTILCVGQAMVQYGHDR